MKKEVRDFTPDEAVLYGDTLEGQGDVANAERLYRSVLVVDPNHFHAQYRLGTLLANRKEYYEAYYRLDRAVRLNKKSDLALSNRGMVLGILGHTEESIVDYERAIHIDPNNYITLANYAMSLEKMERFEEALKMSDRSLALEPNQEVTIHNRGIILFRLGRFEEARDCCTETLRLQPDYHQAAYNRGLCKLLLGDLKGGFEDAEVALLDPTIRKPLFGPFNRPQWDGGDFSGRTLIITGEQGIGDTIQFMRYLPYVRERGGKVVVAVHELARRLYDLPDGFVLLKHGETTPPFHLQCPLLSLPHRLGMEDPPPPSLPLDYYAHLKDGVLLEAWRGRIGHWDGRLRVGLCYSGNPGHKHDKDRSIPLAKLRTLLKAKNAKFYSLQKELRLEDEVTLKNTPDILDLAPFISDFKDTAAAIHNLDMVVTVDTSVAHLSASLAKPTCILLQHFCNDWRWQLKREDSPWYPTVKLYRQDKRGDWDKPLTRLLHDIENCYVS